MANLELVSVVIPTYNRADVIGDAVESALNQTYDPIQVIVIDDGSADGTEDVVEGYDDIIYLPHETNKGANAARNEGIRHADGEFIAFLDADDYWRQDKIQKQISLFNQEADDCGLVHTGIEIRDFEGDQIDRIIPPSIDNPKRRLLLGNYVGTFSCVMVRMEVFNEVGLLDERLPSWQDWEFYLRVADEYGFGSVQDPMTIKRSGKKNQISRDLESLVGTTYPFFKSRIRKESDGLDPLFRRHALAHLRAEVGDAALLNGDEETARRFLFKAVTTYPFELKLLAYFGISLLGVNVYRQVLSTKRRLGI